MNSTCNDGTLSAPPDPFFTDEWCGRPPYELPYYGSYADVVSIPWFDHEAIQQLIPYVFDTIRGVPTARTLRVYNCSMRDLNTGDGGSVSIIDYINTLNSTEISSDVRQAFGRVKWSLQFTYLCEGSYACSCDYPMEAKFMGNLSHKLGGPGVRASTVLNEAEQAGYLRLTVNGRVDDDAFDAEWTYLQKVCDRKGKGSGSSSIRVEVWYDVAVMILAGAAVLWML